MTAYSNENTEFQNDEKGVGEFFVPNIAVLNCTSCRFENELSKYVKYVNFEQDFDNSFLSEIDILFVVSLDKKLRNNIDTLIKKSKKMGLRFAY